MNVRIRFAAEERVRVKKGISRPPQAISLTTVTRGRCLTQGRLPCHSCASQTLLGICKKENRNEKQRKKQKENTTQDVLDGLHLI